MKRLTAMASFSSTHIFLRTILTQLRRYHQYLFLFVNLSFCSLLYFLFCCLIFSPFLQGTFVIDFWVKISIKWGSMFALILIYWTSTWVWGISVCIIIYGIALVLLFWNLLSISSLYLLLQNESVHFKRIILLCIHVYER